MSSSVAHTIKQTLSEVVIVISTKTKEEFIELRAHLFPLILFTSISVQVRDFVNKGKLFTLRKVI